MTTRSHIDRFVRLILTHHSPCIVAIWEVASTCEGLIGIFNVVQETNHDQMIQIPNLPVGNHENLLIDLGVEDLADHEARTISVDQEGRVPVPLVASVLHYTGIVLRPKPFYSEIFDFSYRDA